MKEHDGIFDTCIASGGCGIVFGMPHSSPFESATCSPFCCEALWYQVVVSICEL